MSPQSHTDSKWATGNFGTNKPITILRGSPEDLQLRDTWLNSRYDWITKLPLDQMSESHIYSYFEDGWDEDPQLGYQKTTDRDKAAKESLTSEEWAKVEKDYKSLDSFYEKMMAEKKELLNKQRMLEKMGIEPWFLEARRELNEEIRNLNSDS